jgi:hypothetical protein
MVDKKQEIELTAVVGVGARKTEARRARDTRVKQVQANL